MFTDSNRVAAWDFVRENDLAAFAKFLTPELFSQAAIRAGGKIGKSPLCLTNLVWLGISSAIRYADSFAAVLVVTFKILADVEGFGQTPLGKEQQRCRRNAKRRKRKRSKHDPRRDDPTIVSEEAFSKARRLMPIDYWRALIFLLVERFESEHGGWMYWQGYRLLAIDGTTINLRREKCLIDHFGTAKNGKEGKRSRPTPQARMVLLQSPLTRLPIAYEVTGVSGKGTSEKTMARKLITHVRPNDLLLIDRGFWSYGLFHDIQNRGGFFAIRYFSTAKLRTIRRFGPKDRLVRWTPSDRKWRTEGLPTSMELRAIDYQIKGFRRSTVITNVTDPKNLSREDFVRLSTEQEEGRLLAPGLYHRRWEIETTFSELKVYQGMDNLRSRTPESVHYEIAGHLVLYLLVRWLMVEAAETHGQNPLRLSFVGALRELNTMRVALLTSSEQHVKRVLLPRLLERIASHVVPLRPGRHYQRPGDAKTKNKGNGKGKQQLPAKRVA